MKKKNQLLLGVSPIGKFLFSHKEAVRQKDLIFKKLDDWGINYCHIDSVLPDGMVRDQKHVDPVVEHFQNRKIDALFVPHCNFGTEGAVGMLGKKLQVPVLLWGPRDEGPLTDGSRLRDSLCGLFASSKVLNKLKVPFTYIENCSLDDEAFKNGVSLFLRAAAAAKAVKNMRIGQIGVRIDFFWTTIHNESELLQKFGIQVLPIDMVGFLEGVKSRARKDSAAYKKELARIKEWLVVEGDYDGGLINSLAMRDELLRIAEEEKLDAFSVHTSAITRGLGPGFGLGRSLIQDEMPFACESDLHGAISSVIIEAAAGTGEPGFFPDITIRHPENENAVLLWHGSGPLSLRHPETGKIEMHPSWISRGKTPSQLNFRLKDGPVTLCRFDGDDGRYRLGIGQGKTVPGPHTREFYVWMEVDDWPRWERKLIEGPYIHHCSCIYGHFGHVLEEACKYIPGLVPERFDERQ